MCDLAITTACVQHQTDAKTRGKLLSSSEDLLENKDDTCFRKRHNTEPHMHSASKDRPSENFKDVENFKV